MAKFTHLSIELQSKVFLGNFETISPAVRLTAELEEGDDLSAVRKMMVSELQQMWAITVIEELRLVNKRRNPNKEISDDRLPDVLAGMKEQVKPK